MSRLLFHFLARTACLYTVMLFLVFFTLFTGCSSNIPLRKDFTSKRAINIPDTETPTISYSVKMGSSTDTALDVFLIITAFTIPADRKEKNTALLGMKLPDVGKLMVQRFVEKVAEDGDGWPKVEMVGRFDSRVRIDPEALENPTSSGEVRLELWVIKNRIEIIPGYRVTVEANMYDYQDLKGILKKTIKYESLQYERHRTFEEYIAEDGKLLREEIRYAADKIADKLFEALQSDLEKRTWERVK